jgi:hypothetical protein
MPLSITATDTPVPSSGAPFAPVSVCCAARLRVAIQVVRRRLGDEFREPAESELSAGVTSPPVSGVRGLPLTPDDFLR